MYIFKLSLFELSLLKIFKNTFINSAVSNAVGSVVSNAVIVL